MNSQQVIRPHTLQDAAEALDRLGNGAQLVAGGTDMMTHLRRGKSLPAHWVDLSHVKGHAREIRVENQRVVMGCLVTFQELADSDIIRDTLPALRDAARIMGSVQIRSRGTLGGNIGNASPAGDSLPPLLVAEAEILTLSVRGARKIPVENFFVGPGRTCLEPGELIVAASFPILPHARSAYHRVGNRAAHEIAKVGAALRFRLNNGRLHNVRMALGAVAPTVIRVLAAESLLEGQILEEGLLSQVAAAAAAAARPINDIRSTAQYRGEMCRELVVQLLGRLVQGAEIDPGIPA